MRRRSGSDSAEVEDDQSCCERSVDEGAVDQEVYFVEAIAKDGYADSRRKSGDSHNGRDAGDRLDNTVMQRHRVQHANHDKDAKNHAL